MRFIMMGVLAVAVGMASPAQAQTTANGPYYATPSWDQTLPAATRFIVLSNFSDGAVLDRETGLVWQRFLLTFRLDWNRAQYQCLTMQLGGRMGWRLPAAHELTSLIDPAPTAQDVPSFPTGHPFVGVQLADYWSATAVPDEPTLAFSLLTFRGIVSSNEKTSLRNFWCVRGGMSAAQ